MGNGGGNPLNQTDFTPEVQYFTERTLLNSTFLDSSLNVTNILMYLDYDYLFNQENLTASQNLGIPAAAYALTARFDCFRQSRQGLGPEAG